MNQLSVCILNYGSGNVESVANLFRQLADDVRISNSEEDILAATHLVLPGVGAFKAAMDMLVATVPLGLVEQRITRERIPILGICVGLQVMADVGEEFGETRGLGWIPGHVRQLEVGELTLPHTGWNNLSLSTQTHPLLDGITPEADFYFVHSFAFAPDTQSDYVLATCDYGVSFPTVLARGNVMGVQFHPEKSQQAGLQIARNFLKLTPVVAS
jgi:imidazole glycerol-phosphate synthase subunit HisH